eukprot:gene8036-9884_t
MQLVPMNYFQECIEYNTSDNKTLAFPKKTCKANCLNTTEICGIPTRLIDCNSNDPDDPTTPLFPQKEITYDLTSFGGPSSFTVECFDPSLLNGTREGQCPYPLKFRNVTSDEERELDEKRGYYYVSKTSKCLLPCPVPIYTPNQWDRLFTLSTVLSWIRIVNSVDTRRNLCPTQWSSATMDNRICGFHGIVYQFFSVNAIQWFTILAFDLWYVVKNASNYFNTLDGYVECANSSPTPELCTGNGPNYASITVFVISCRIWGFYCLIVHGLGERVKKIWMTSVLVNNRFVLPIVIKIIEIKLSSSSINKKTQTTADFTNTPKKSTNVSSYTSNDYDESSVSESQSHTIEFSTL